jgi:hypothetical protein
MDESPKIILPKNLSGGKSGSRFFSNKAGDIRNFAAAPRLAVSPGQFRPLRRFFFAKTDDFIKSCFVPCPLPVFMAVIHEPLAYP